MSLPERPRGEEKRRVDHLFVSFNSNWKWARRAEVRESSCEGEKEPLRSGECVREGVERPNEVHLFRRV